MEVASHHLADSLRIRMPAMEKGFVDADDGERSSDRFGPERRAVVVPSSAATLGGGVPCQSKAFLVGFKDCHQEVLQYLVNIEQVPLEGPVMFGLEKHLKNLESRMQATSSCETLAQSNCCSTQLRGDKTEDDEVEEEEDDDFSSFKNYLTTAQDDRFLEEEEEEEPVCDASSSSSSSSSRGRNGHRTTTAAAAVRAENGSFDSGCCSSDSSGLLLVASSSASDDSMDCSYDEVSTTAPRSDVADPPKQRGGGGGGGGCCIPTDDSADTAVTESELAENALELMHLAHNNPCISRILNELFVLMDNDYDDDDVDDDDDDDEEDDRHDDGIEMEENDGLDSEFHDDC